MCYETLFNPRKETYEHVSYQSHENTGKEPKKISTAITDSSHLYT